MNFKPFRFKMIVPKITTKKLPHCELYENSAAGILAKKKETQIVK